MATSSAFDFENNQVQRELLGSNFLKGETTIIAAGPPFLNFMGITNNISPGSGGESRRTDVPSPGRPYFGAADLGGVPVFPIGVIENANIVQQRQLRRIPEIGSKRFHFVSGRTAGQITISRVMFHGPNLLRVLYAYINPDRFTNASGSIGELLGNNADSLYSSGLDNAKILSNPGYADFFVNLDSTLFDYPFGLMFYFEDNKREPYGAFYCEEAHIAAHQMNIGASTTVIAEAVTIQYDQLVPIDLGNNSLFGRSS